jgi:signal transduction histidine kinase
MIALALAGLGLLAVTIIQIQFGLAPLRRIERGLAAVRSGDAQELTGDLPAEIKPLQAELNALIHSNHEIIERARTQVGNLAHALKTPLAVITNEAGDNKTEFAAKVAEQANIMREQVTHYLDRARMAARANVIGRATTIGPVAQSLKRALERINRDKGVTIAIDCPNDLRFQGEQQDLEEMLGNLLDNACKWSKSAVHLTAAPAPPTASGQRMLTIVVEDDGKGLSAEQRAKIGKRGTRLDESTPGTGLGLSIVADIATTYRGAMMLEASPRGGLLIRLDLPSA